MAGQTARSDALRALTRRQKRLEEVDREIAYSEGLAVELAQDLDAVHTSLRRLREERGSLLAEPQAPLS